MRLRKKPKRPDDDTPPPAEPAGGAGAIPDPVAVAPPPHPVPPPPVSPDPWSIRPAVPLHTGDQLPAIGVEDGWPSYRPVVVGESSVPRTAVPVVGPARSVYRPDTVLDGWTEAGLGMLAASVRGDGHRRTGLPRQDDVAVLYDAQRRRVVVAVADGLSAASHAHQAASAACRYAVQWLDTQCGDVAATDIPWEALIGAAAHQVRLVAEQAVTPDPGLDDLARLNVLAAAAATTFSCVVMDMRDGEPEQEYLSGSGVAIGDSSVVRLSEAGFEFLGGAKSEDPGGLARSEVLPLPYFAPSTIEPFSVDLYADEYLLVGTDGVWDALGGGGGRLGSALGRVLRRAQPSMTEFGHVVDFAKDTFDDDRTLAALWLSERGENDGCD